MAKYSTSRINYLSNGSDNIIKRIVKKIFFKNDIYNSIGCRSPYINFKFTKHEAAEIAKCKNDIVYFAETYYVIDGGRIKLRQYQKDILNSYVEGRTIICSARQSGISTLNKIYSIWSVLFNTKYIQIISEPTYSLYEFMKSIIAPYSKLPYFMQKGIVSFGRNEILFDDSSRISSLQPRVINKWLALKKYSVIVENCAFMRRSSFSNIESIIKSGSDIHITSCPNGLNGFYKLWQDSLADNKNNFKTFRIDWHDVPERTEDWSKEMIKIIGQDEFDIQYNLMFRNKS